VGEGGEKKNGVFWVEEGRSAGQPRLDVGQGGSRKHERGVEEGLGRAEGLGERMVGGMECGGNGR
jgi:hypothetical protein